MGKKVITKAEYFKVCRKLQGFDIQRDRQRIRRMGLLLR